LCQQIYPSRNQSVTSNVVNQYTENIFSDKQQQQSSTPPETEEHEHVALSSDFLVDIVRQIRTIATTTHLPSIDDSQTEITESMLDSAIAELTNSSNSILNVPSELSPEKFINRPQLLEITPEISSSSLVSFESSTPSETGFDDSYQNPYFSFNTNEQTFSNFTSMEDEQLDEKEATPDLRQIYYELREQRHTQPVLDNTLTEQIQETSNINLDNQNKQFDIQSFPITTNLPTREYRQVFGASDNIIDTVDDLIDHVDQTVQSNISNEEFQIKENFEDHQSIIPPEQKELVKEITPSTTSNAELDLRYSLLLDRMSALLQPLMDLSSSSFDNETKSISSNIEDSLLTIENEQISNANDTDVSTTLDQTTSTTQSISDNDQTLTPSLANSEPIVSKSSQENVTKSEDDEQEPIAHQTELPTSISSEEHTANVHEHKEIIDSSNVTDHIKSVVTTVISNFTNILPASTFIQETSTATQTPVAEPELQSPILTDEINVISKSNEQIEIEEVNNQKQSSSTGLFELMKTLLSPTLQSNTPIETNLENVRSQQHDTVENPIDNFNLSNTDTNQQTAVSREFSFSNMSYPFILL
jgi:hypothetical protein